MSDVERMHAKNGARDHENQAATAVLDHPDTKTSPRSSRGQDSDPDKNAWVDSDPRPVIATDRDHRIVYMNEAAAVLTGRRPEQALGALSWEVIDSAVAAKANARLPRQFGWGTRFLPSRPALSGDSTLPLRSRQLRDMAGTMRL